MVGLLGGLEIKRESLKEGETQSQPSTEVQVGPLLPGNTDGSVMALLLSPESHFASQWNTHPVTQGI